MTLYECVDMYINQFGIEKVFGVPGSLIMPIWQNINSAELVLCSHEQEASYLAVGYTKMSRKPTMVITTGGPGVTNCVSGIAAANLDSLPVIYISGRVPTYAAGLGLRQDEGYNNRCFESTEIMKSVTKLSVQIKNLQTAQKDLFYAFKCAVTNRMGSVHISIPVDLQDGNLLVEHTQYINTFVSENESSSVCLSKLLNDNKRKLFIIGWGCWLDNAYSEIYHIAEKCNIPILATVKAYCCICRHDWIVGKIGYGYNDCIAKFVSEYNPEEVIVFGSSLSMRNFTDELIESFCKAQIHIFSLDVCAENCKRTNAIFHQVDSLNCLLRGISIEQQQPNQDLMERIKQCQNDQLVFWNSFSCNQMLTDICIHIASIINEKITVTADAGNHLLEIAALVQPQHIKNIFLDDGIRAMGSGICETVGMAFADQHRHYLAVTGDGCMLMNGNIMYIAKKYALPITFLVINNSSLGRVRVGQMPSGRFVQSDLGGVNYTDYAKAFALESFRVNDMAQYVAKLDYCLRMEKPTLIEVNVPINEVPTVLLKKGKWN